MKKHLFKAIVGVLLLTALAVTAATTKVTTSLWSGQIPMGDWAGYVVLSANDVKDFETGCRLMVTVDEVDNTKTAMVYLNTSTWTDFNPAQKQTVTAPGTVSFTITEAMMTEISGKGLVVKGCGATLRKIALQKEVELGGGGTSLDDAIKEIWTGSQLVSWEEPNKGWATIAAADFASLKKGDKLRFGISNVKAGAQSRIVTSKWATIPGTEIESASRPYFEYAINDEALAEIKANGLIVSGNGFTLTSVSIVDPAKLPNLVTQVNKDCVKAWAKGSTPAIELEIQNLQAEAVTVPVRALITTDAGAELDDATAVTVVTPGATGEVSLPLEGLDAGVYHITLLANEQVVDNFNIAVDLEGITSAPDAQTDFNSFWQTALSELASVEPAYKLTEITDKSGSKRKIYLVEMNSIADSKGGEPVVIRGYYAEPVGSGKHAAIITYQGYDSAAYGPDGKPTDPYCPDGNSGDMAEFILSTRGQSINNRAPYTNTYGDWFAFNFGDKDTYYYRGAYMDAVRALDFIASRDKVDAGKIFAQGQSQGGALTIAAAALDPAGRLKAIAPAVPFMGDFPDYFKVAAWPRSVAVKCASEKGLTDEQMYRFLSYFDTKNLAPAIKCPVIQAIGLQDDICPPHTNMAPYNNLKVANKKLVVNPMNAHSVPSTWHNEYMAWFNQAIDGMPEIAEITTNIFTGEMPMNWSALALGADLFKYAKAGDRLRLTLSQIASDRNKWPQLKITDKNSKDLWPSRALYDSEKGFEAPYAAEYEIDEAIAANLRGGGCRINGTGYTLASVDIIGSQEISTAVKNPSRAVMEIWSGEERISWANDDTKNSVLIDKSKFESMKAGNIVRVSMSDVANNAQLRLQANYTQFDPVSNTQLKGAVSHEVTFDADMVALVKEKGLRLSGCYYTLNRVEIVDAGQNVNSMSLVSTTCVKAYEKTEQPTATVNIQSLEAYDYDVPVAVTLFEDVDPSTPVLEKEQTVSMKARAMTPANISLGELAPGFYKMSVSVNGTPAGSYTIGSRPTEIEVVYDGQEDFDAFWADGLAELAQVEPEYTLVKEMTDKSTEARKVWYVEMKSVADTKGGEPVIISGYYAEPTAEGSYPCLVHFQGTDGGNSTPWCMGGDDKPEWCEFVLSVRGQMLNNREPNTGRNIYTLDGMSYYTFGLANDDYKREHYYFGAYLDCVRAIDFVKSREKVDAENIFCEGGSQGGAFTYAAAALAATDIRACAPGITGHADFPVDFKVASWPANQILPLADNNGISHEDMMTRLSYFDVKNFAHMVSCPVTTNLSLQDTTDPPHVGFAPFNLLEVTDKEYLVNPLLGHSTAPDWSDRYMDFFERHMKKAASVIETPGIATQGTFSVSSDGLTLRSDAATPLTVYNLTGQAVAVGHTPLRLPAAGLYIVTNGKTSCKISVK